MQVQIIKLTDGGELVKTPITAFHGQQEFHCKTCQEYVNVAFEVKGKSPATEESGPIYWHYLVGKCGHDVKEMSY